MTNAYRGESTGFVTKGNRRRRFIRKRYRERKAREFVGNLNKRELAELRRAITELDEGLSPGAEHLKRSAGLEVWESIQRRGKQFIDKVRGKK